MKQENRSVHGIYSLNFCFSGHTSIFIFDLRMAYCPCFFLPLSYSLIQLSMGEMPLKKLFLSFFPFCFYSRPELKKVQKCFMIIFSCQMSLVNTLTNKEYLFQVLHYLCSKCLLKVYVSWIFRTSNHVLSMCRNGCIEIVVPSLGNISTWFYSFLY